MKMVLTWLGDHPAVIWWFAALSVVMLAVGIVLVPFLVARIPEDYFAEKKRAPLLRNSQHIVLRIILHVVKNVLGLVVLAIGIVLIFMPGQGILSIMAGISLLEFPGKYRFQRWLVSHRTILRSINWIRRKAKRNPLIIHGHRDTHEGK